MARKQLSKMGLAAEAVEAVVNLVLLTAHGKVLKDVRLSESLVDLLLDIDLAVHGSDAETYEGFERAIAREYAWVPSAVYVPGRERVLQMFLPKSAGGTSESAYVFRTDVARAQGERQAHENLRRALALLSAAGRPV